MNMISKAKSTKSSKRCKNKTKKMKGGTEPENQTQPIKSDNNAEFIFNHDSLNKIYHFIQFPFLFS